MLQVGLYPGSECFEDGLIWFIVGYGCYLSVSTTIKVRGSTVDKGC